MDYYVLTFGSNWADEFDVESFVVVSQEKFDELKTSTDQALENVINQHGWYRIWFGTNESLEFPSPENYWSCITVKSITEEQAKTFYRAFRKRSEKFDEIKSNKAIVRFGTVDFFPLDDYSDAI